MATPPALRTASRAERSKRASVTSSLVASEDHSDASTVLGQMSALFLTDDVPAALSVPHDSSVLRVAAIQRDPQAQRRRLMDMAARLQL
eukprot:gene10456-13268_t